MASYPALRRPGKRPARAGRLVVRVPLIVVVLALVGAAAVAFQLTGFDGTSSKAKPATLSPSVLLEKPALGGKLDLDSRGLVVTSGQSSFSLAFHQPRHSRWQLTRNSARRSTPYGLETITLGTNRAEQSVRVDRHQGTRLWRWHLTTTKLTPRLSADGSVRFKAGSKDAGLRILPVKLFNRAGKNGTTRAATSGRRMPGLPSPSRGPPRWRAAR